MCKISSYGKVYALGHRAVRDLFSGPVIVEEKTDGSQFSFKKNCKGIFFRSRNKMVDRHAPGMFDLAVEAVRNVGGLLNPGWTYRGEYIRKEKHNTLRYDRVPAGNIIIWDIDRGTCDYLTHEEKKAEAERLGFEVAPLLFEGLVTSPDEVKRFLELESFLGGPKIEGVVLKRYDVFCDDGKIMAGKYVSEVFKETNRENWDKGSQKDILAQIGEFLQSEARWRKAVERMRDAGELQMAPQDIGPLIKSIQADIEEECEEEVKDKLYAWAKKHKIYGKAIYGFPEWYKQFLLEEQFGEDNERE